MRIFIIKFLTHSQTTVNYIKSFLITENDSLDLFLLVILPLIGFLSKNHLLKAQINNLTAYNFSIKI